MIYLETYFDLCNGVIPQMVLSAMLLQAGNQRASAYKNALTVNLTSSNTFSFDGYFLTLQGVLPLTESRYLLTVPSLINRIGAMNNENVIQLNDLVGLPVNGFSPRPGLTPVALPPNIANLSEGVLVLEKRLAYLLLLQAKRNNLNILYNYLYYTRLAGEIQRRTNAKSPQITNNSSGSYISGWVYSYTVDVYGRSTSITNACISNLFTTYSALKSLLPATATTFELICDWLQIEMSKDNPVTLPNLDFDLLTSNIADTIAQLRYQEPLHDPQGLVSIDNQGDVSSEITANGDSASPPIDLPSNPYSQQNSDSPLIDRPSADYSSLASNSPTTDPLPGC